MIEIKPNTYNTKKGKFIGVGFDNQRKKFKARIRVNGKTKCLGFYDNEIDGALEYDKAVKLYGLKSRLNFNDPEPENLIPNTRLIRLTLGKFAIVDAEDFEEVNKFKWYAVEEEGIFYAVKVTRIEGKRSTLRMHRFITGVTDPEIKVDHWDRNGLNNTRPNLRTCTNQENTRNQVGSDKTSLLKGVFFDVERGKWMAQIKVDGKSQYLGRFDNEIAAGEAYDLKASEVFGEFAYLNFPW